MSAPSGYDDRARVEARNALLVDVTRIREGAPDFGALDAALDRYATTICAPLVEALRPFAGVADVADFYIREVLPTEESLTFPDERTLRVYEEGPSRVRLTYDDFYRARAAVQAVTP